MPRGKQRRAAAGARAWARAARRAAPGLLAPSRRGLKPRPRVQRRPGRRSGPGSPPGRAPRRRLRRHLPGLPGRLSPWAAAAHRGRGAAERAGRAHSASARDGRTRTGANPYAESAGRAAARGQGARAAGRGARLRLRPGPPRRGAPFRPEDRTAPPLRRRPSPAPGGVAGARVGDISDSWESPAVPPDGEERKWPKVPKIFRPWEGVNCVLIGHRRRIPPSPSCSFIQNHPCPSTKLKLHHHRRGEWEGCCRTSALSPVSDYGDNK